MASLKQTGDSGGKEGAQGACSTSILKAGGQEEALKVWKLSEQTTSLASCLPGPGAWKGI